MASKKLLSQIVLLSFVGALSQNIFAASTGTITVKQVKGANAIVAFPKGMTPKVGSQYKVSPASANNEEDMGAADEGMATSTAHGSRAQSLALVANASKPKGSGLTFEFSGSLGWNMGSFEFGPTLSAGRASTTVGTTTTSTTSFGAGAFADINFTENKAGESFVPALGLTAGFSKAGSANTLKAGAELALKFFALGTSSTAIRVAPFFDFSKLSSGTSYDLGLRAGLGMYF